MSTVSNTTKAAPAAAPRATLFANKAARLAAAQKSKQAHEETVFVGAADVALSGVSFLGVVLSYTAGGTGATGKNKPNEIEVAVLPQTFDTPPDPEFAAPTADGLGWRVYIKGSHLKKNKKADAAAPAAGAGAGDAAPPAPESASALGSVGAMLGVAPAAAADNYVDPDANLPAVVISNTSAAAFASVNYGFAVLLPGMVVKVKTYSNSTKFTRELVRGDVIAVNRVSVGVLPYTIRDAARPNAPENKGAALSFSTPAISVDDDLKKTITESFGALDTVGALARYFARTAPFTTRPFAVAPPLTQLYSWPHPSLNQLPERTLAEWKESEVLEEEDWQRDHAHFFYVMAPGPMLPEDGEEEDFLACVTSRGNVACNYGATVVDTSGDAEKFVLPASEGRPAAGRMQIEQDVLQWSNSPDAARVHVVLPLVGTSATLVSGIATPDVFKEFARFYGSDVRLAARVRVNANATANSKTNKSNGDASNDGNVSLAIEYSEFTPATPGDNFVPTIESNLASIVRRRGFFLGEAGKKKPATEFAFAVIGGNPQTYKLTGTNTTLNAMNRSIGEAPILNLCESDKVLTSLGANMGIYVLVLEDQTLPDSVSAELREKIGNAASTSPEAAAAALSFFGDKGKFPLKRNAGKFVIYAIMDGVGSEGDDEFDALAKPVAALAAPAQPAAAAATTTTAAAGQKRKADAAPQQPQSKRAAPQPQQARRQAPSAAAVINDDDGDNGASMQSTLDDEVIYDGDDSAPVSQPQPQRARAARA